MIPFREVAVLDGNAAALGVPPSRLMENAGAAVADHVIRRYAPGRALVACGSGNNGGDGYVAARRLAEAGVEVTVLAAGEPSTGLALDAAVALPAGVRRIALEDLTLALDRADVVVDALLGVGARGEPRGPYGSIVDSLNGAGVPVVSVDVPSGFGTGSAVEADETVTFHDIKEGMEGLADVFVVDIGIPPEASLFTGPGELTLVPGRARDAHKGDGGRVLVVGGGPYTGAPALAAMAALRSGCDIATVAAPASAAPIIAGFSPNLIVRSLPGDHLGRTGAERVVNMLPGYDVLLVGPGLGPADDTVGAVHGLVPEAMRNGIRLVMDADALRAFAAFPDSADLFPGPGAGDRGVLTPHAGELGRIAPGDGAEAAVDLSLRTGFTVLLKGAEDVIVDGQRTKRNRTGNPGMTVGGTGDVLAGCVAGLMARGMGPFDAARVGAYVTGRAGDIAYELFGLSLLATDVIDALPDALGGS